MHYTIYKVKNKINGKIYIGKHQTYDLIDGYMGSGKLIQAAIEKYGIENFTKEILYIFKTEDEMNSKEKEMVTEEFVKRKDTYNMTTGGQGSWDHLKGIPRTWINSDTLSKRDMSYFKTEAWSKKISKINTGLKRTKEHKKNYSNYAKNRTPEHQAKLDAFMKEHNKRIKSPEEIEKIKAAASRRAKCPHCDFESTVTWVTRHINKEHITENV
jgi:hypothetical protein